MRRSINITNKTEFDTRTIRSIILAVARKHLKPTEYKDMNVTVGYPKRSYVTGKAVIGRATSPTCCFSLFIPKGHTDVIEVCQRVKTCLDYCKGVHGGTFGTEFNDWYQRLGNAKSFPFAAKIILGKTPVRVKQKLTGASAAMKKAEAAQEKVDYWERKVKYANTMLKKWRTQLKYHEARGEKLFEAEAEKMEQQQGMSVEEFLKLPPVEESDQ